MSLNDKPTSLDLSHRGHAQVEKLSFMTILCHFGCIIPNIRLNLDMSFRTFMSHWTFLVILDSVTKDHVFTSDGIPHKIDLSWTMLTLGFMVEVMTWMAI